jgi:hypothetical protein
MIDLLLINPGEQAQALVSALSVNNVSYQIITTNGQMFAYPPSLDVLDLNTNPWDRSQQYKSSIAWNVSGQRWLDGISEQVVLNNKPLIDRKEHYLTNKFEVELGKMFNILSYKGRHVIIDAFVYKNAKWNIIKDQTTPFFVNGVEDAFTFLDAAGILNGPSQVFIEPNGKVHVRLVPKNITVDSASTRKFLEIWPYLLTLEVEQPKKAILAFYSWVERTGPSKQFQLANGL